MNSPFLTSYIYYVTVSECLSFPYTIMPSAQNVNEYVWFDEPAVLTYHQSESTTPSSNINDWTWFETPDFIHQDPEDFGENENKTKHNEITAKQAPWITKDEIFARYFFGNKWK